MRQTSSTVSTTGKVWVGRGRYRSTRGQGALKGDFEEELEGRDGDCGGGAGKAEHLVQGEEDPTKLLGGDLI